MDDYFTDEIYEKDAKGLTWYKADEVQPEIGLEVLVETEDYERLWCVWDGKRFVRRQGGAIIQMPKDIEVRAFIWTDTEE